jgi:hypothetical protein
MNDELRELLGLDTEGNLTDKSFNTSSIAYVIKKANGDIVWHPYNQGDCGSSSPFPKGYIPQLGQKIVLSDKKNTQR